MKVACLLTQATYKPGDQPPEGYLAWHEWADVQRKAKIKQVECGKCGLWKTPQELSDKYICFTGTTARGVIITTNAPVCNKCNETKQPTGDKHD